MKIPTMLSSTECPTLHMTARWQSQTLPQVCMLHTAQHTQHANIGRKISVFQNLCCEATFAGGAAAQHDIGATHIPMDDVALMHVSQGRHHFLSCGDDS